MDNKRIFEFLLIATVLAVLAAAGPMSGSALALNETNITVDSTANSEGDLAGDGNDELLDYNGSSDVTEVFAIRVNISTEAGSLDEITTNFTLTDSEGKTISHHSDEKTSSFLGSSEAWIDADHEGGYLNFTWADLETVPMEINENVTIQVEITASTDNSADSDASTTFDLLINNTDDRSVIYLEEETTDYEDSVDVEERSPSSLAFWADDQPDFHEVDDTRNVEAGNTSVIMFLEESDMQDHYADRSESFSDDGDIIWSFTAWDDDEDTLYPVFLNEFDDDVLDLDEEEDTYMIYHEDDDELEIVVGDDYDEDDLDMIVANHHPGHLDAVGFSETRELYGTGALAVRSTFDIGIFAVTTTGLTAGVFLVRRRRRTIATEVDAEQAEA